MDYPKLRQTIKCPLCSADKSRGLVICWDCNRELKTQNWGGWGDVAEEQLAFAEAGIA